MFAAVVVLLPPPADQPGQPVAAVGPALPGDWFYRQRAFPQGHIAQAAYRGALRARSRQLHQKASRSRPNEYDNSWQFAGPTNIGGRITDIEMPASRTDVIYAGTASGGIFKSVDQGHSWSAIFDEQPSLTIGDLAIAPSRESWLYAGTGEPNAGGGSLAYEGMGVFKSTDGGRSWQPLGLSHSGSIGKIVVHPRRPELVYVAAMGPLFAPGGERGVYRSTDGGANWQRVLHVSDSTGAIDLAIHPYQPDTLYAAMWERIRRPHRRQYGGATSGIYRSFDGGQSWEELTNGLPAAAAQKGRIGIAIAPSNPEILYAVYADAEGKLQGIYQSFNHGSSWIQRNSSGIIGVPFMWWFGKIFISPHNPRSVYVASLHLHHTQNGGHHWRQVFEGAHVDQHALYIHPLDSNLLVAGNDGGIYLSHDGGENLYKVKELPVTQFYTVEVDESQPVRLYGGTQDNGVNRSLSGSHNDWEAIYGGDGFVVLVDPTDPTYVYAESQYGLLGRSTDGGRSFVRATTGISGRRNWKTPVVFAPHDTRILYYGAERLYRSTNRAVSWQPISPDLSGGPGLNLVFGTITAIGLSPLNPEVIYAGTDDGHVWVSPDGGQSWNDISTGLPRRWVTSLLADPLHPQGVYVSFSGYRQHDHASHLYKSTDLGRNWTDISGNLPDVPVNECLKDPHDSTLYVATDVGVFFSENEGQHWELLGTGLPAVVISDLRLHAGSRKLVAATYGRSLYTYQLPALPTALPGLAAQGVRLFSPFGRGLRLYTPVGLHARLQGYSLQGNGGDILFEGYLQPGYHQFSLPGQARAGGLYLCRLQNLQTGSQLTQK
ncbi:MAG: hypothetical protein D6730_15665, partial [Bacteroidetes bacterium]